MELDKIISIHSYLENKEKLYSALSEDNEYIPIQCLKNGEILKLTDRERKILVYSLPVPTLSSAGVTSLINRFCGVLFKMRRTETGSWTTISDRVMLSKYYADVGILLHLDDNYEFKPLLMLTVRRDYLFRMDKGNPAHFCLVIDNSFIRGSTDSSKLYRNVKRIYIDELEKNQFDVLYTNDILRVCFSKSIELPKFESITDMTSDFSSMNQSLLDSLVNSTING